MNATMKSRIEATERVEDVLELKVRYVRSVNISRDRTDPDALHGYIATTMVSEAMTRLLKGLGPDSTQRAWRLTGPYGSGKSYFGLAVLNALRPDSRGKGALRQMLSAESPELKHLFDRLPRYLPIVVAGSRQDAATLLVNALADSVGELPAGSTRTSLLKRLRGFGVRRAKGKAQADEAIRLLTDTASFVQKSKEYDGVFVLVDELGLLVEYATDSKSHIDPGFFQLLAEVAGGRAEPRIGVLGLLHQRFEDYALANVDAPRAQEWAKVAERYEDIAFNEPLESTCQLLVRALGLNRSKTTRLGIERAGELLAEQAMQMGLLRQTEGLDPHSVVPALYPLHPSSVVALVSYFRRFGQNERSIFSFLTSSEVAGLQDFAARNHAAAGTWYRLHHLCDYALAQGGLRSFEEERQKRWSLLHECLRMAAILSSTELEIVKTVGILNLLEPVAGVDVSAESIAFARTDNPHDAQTIEALNELVRRRVLYKRGASGDFCIWPQSSVDLSLELEKARKAVPPLSSFKPVLETLPPPKPILAHRHYLSTGTLRAMAVRVLDSQLLDVSGQAPKSTTDDGLLVVVPVSAGAELPHVTARVKRISADASSNVVYAIRKISEGQLVLARDLLCWKYIEKGCEELKVDAHAKREVHRTIDNMTERMLLELADLYAPANNRGQTVFYHQGRAVSLDTGRDLNRWVSELFDTVFQSAPIIRNELINRLQVSKAAAAARQKLVELMISGEPKEALGLEKTPPEKAIYLSIFQGSGLHRRTTATGPWHFSAPTKTDPLNWRPVWQDLHARLTSGKRHRVDELLKIYSAPPFGLRDGPALLLVVTYLLANRSDVVVRDRGTFVTEVGPAHIARLARRPELFDIHRVSTSPPLRRLLATYTAALAEVGREVDDHANVTLIVRQLYEWFIQLPEYTTHGAVLSAESKSLVTAFAKSGDPIDLLLSDIPASLGHGDEIQSKDSAQKSFRKALLACVKELSGCHERLRVDIVAFMSHQLGCEESAADVRKALTKLADAAGQGIEDYQLHAFVVRTLERDRELDAWLTSVAHLLGGRAMDTWRQEHVSRFKSEFKRLHEALKRYVGLRVTVHKRGGQVPNYVGIHLVDGVGREKVFAVENQPLARTDGSAEVIRKALAKSDNPTEVLARLFVEFAQKSN
jgi:hypothetical protein